MTIWRHSWTGTAAALMGCAQAGPASVPVPPALQASVDQALKDAAARSQRPVADLQVLLAETVQWSDGSIGCPVPDRMYRQMLVPGYRIRIQAGAQTLDFHGTDGSAPAFCPAERVRAPLPRSAPG